MRNYRFGMWSNYLLILGKIKHDHGELKLDINLLVILLEHGILSCQ